MPSPARPSPSVSALLVVVAALSGCGGTGSEPPADPGPTPSTRPDAPSDSPLVDLVTSPALAPYWHAEYPGRTPLRIVAAPDSSDRPAFHMGGEPVQWITAAEATPGSAYLEVHFQLVDGLLNLSVRYPVEGIRASAVYAPDGGGWRRMAPVRVVEEER